MLKGLHHRIHQDLLMGKLLSLIIILLSSCAHDRGVDSVVCIPENYNKDYILIIYSDHGENKEFLNHKRLYRIPENGILFTKFNMQRGKMVTFNFYKSNTHADTISKISIFEKTNELNINHSEKYIGIGHHIYTENLSGFDCRFFYYSEITRTSDGGYSLKKDYTEIQKEMDSITQNYGWDKNKTTLE